MWTSDILRLISISGLIAFLSVSARGEEAARGGSDFVRFVEAPGDARLEVAVASYLNAEGRLVDLVGAVHLADPSFYDGLNRRFKHYDAVLFELVGDPEGLVHKEAVGGGLNAVRFLQTAMTRVLDLQFQLDGIDYAAKNFVHADLTIEEFTRMQRDRGESIFTFVGNMMRVQMEAEGFHSAQPGVIDIVTAFASGDRAGAFKRLLAKQIAEMEALLSAAEELESTVIFTERNQRVMETLQKEIEGGAKKMAVFFGAGHHVDLEQRLLERGFQKVGESWLTAWLIGQ